LSDRLGAIKELIEGRGMKYVIAILLLGLSGLLGCVVSMNIYFATKAAGSSQLNAIAKPNVPMQVIFALFAIACFVGGIVVLRRREEKP
jgi:hypothetical protein